MIKRSDGQNDELCRLGNRTEPVAWYQVQFGRCLGSGAAISLHQPAFTKGAQLVSCIAQRGAVGSVGRFQCWQAVLKAQGYTIIFWIILGGVQARQSDEAHCPHFKYSGHIRRPFP